ncbi:MAG: hypothetical protein J6A14_03970 [Spirochaetaceae bacterium]|nr:hypothetical protein [Spirochaetaceae bacterium]
MQKTDILAQAEKAFRARNFSKVISLLEPQIIEYKENFRFYYLLGVSCMYRNDFGGAESYLSRARRIKLNSSDLMVAQAALFLRRGDIPRAVEYYLEVLEYAPNNKTAKKALKYIRNNSAEEKVQSATFSKNIMKFFPSTGLHPLVPVFSIIVVCVLVFGVFFATNYKRILGLNGTRADLSAFVLSVDEKSHPLEMDLSTTNYRYILSSTEVAKLYGEAQTLFQQGKDNAVQININKLLNSNASTAIKYKANLLLEYLEEPSFDNFSNTFSYEDLKQDPYLYQNCWIILSGRISNVNITENVYFCDLLVGYEDMKKLDGIVPMEISQPITIDATQGIKVLGKIVLRDGKVALEVKSIYQPLQKNF